MNKIVNLPLDDVEGMHDYLECNAPVAEYLQQLNTLMLVRHVTLLMIEVQKHRGASMVVLAGNQEFANRVEHSQRVILSYIEIIQQLNLQAGEPIAREKWQSVTHDWQALIAHWQHDPVMANFEFHNHLIDLMVKLIWELISQCHFSGNARSESTEGEGMSQVLLTITLKLMPGLLENMARVRGLAAHVCSLGASSPEFDSRFVALLHDLSMTKEKMRAISRGLQHDTLRAVPSLPEILLHDHKLDHLKQIVSTRIIAATHITVESEELFDFASDVINTYAQVIHDGITYFRRGIVHQLQLA